MFSKYRKALPYVLIGLTLIIIGLGSSENLTAMGAGMLAIGLMFIWQAEGPTIMKSSTDS